MKMLVTGGTGFTGSHLVKRLLSRGHQVRVLDNQEGILIDDLKAAGAEITLGSVTDRSLLEKLVPGCEVVYHLAAAFRKINVPSHVYKDTNVGGTRGLLELCERESVRKIVYCSTQGVHGNIKNPPGNEDSPIAPEDYYQQTKYDGEVVAHEFMQRGLDITILRPTALYGPGDPGRFLMLFRQVKKGSFPFFGNGQTLYHPLYVDNFVDAFELAESRPEAKGQTYLIADEKFYPIKEIVLEIARIMKVDVKTPHYPFWPLYIISAVVELLYKPFPVDPPLFRRRADWYRQNRAFSIDKARRELGYQPAVGLRDGLTRTYEWYKSHGYLD